MASVGGDGAKLAPGALSLSTDDYLTPELVEEPLDVDGEKDAPATGAAVVVDRKRSAAASLPAEVMEQILYLADPDTFASLVLVSRAWREAAENPSLYAYHISRCPSFAASHSVMTGPFAKTALLDMKRQLVQESKRNLFAVFMRPQETVINLISTTTSSSSAFPYGEKFEFSFSHRAQYCLAISSSRVIVLDTASPEVSVKRELKVVRRPLSACILSDGSRLAVLSTVNKVNIYDLAEEKTRFLRSIHLNDDAHAIAMSINGEVLAVACEEGIEVASLAETSLPIAKRSIKCDRVDSLSFSSDGTMLLGTTLTSRSPSTVILSAPYFTDVADHDMDHAELVSHMWTSQIIFPNGSRDCSHAALLPRKHDHDANWTLTYDRVFESFRAVRTDDLRNGTTYFTGPEPREQTRKKQTQTPFVPRTLPTITPQGELVAAAFLGSEIWLYGVPEDLDNPGVKYGKAHARSRDVPEGEAVMTATAAADRSDSPRLDSERLPGWQVLVDKYRNVFAKGRRIANVSGVSNICWSTSKFEDGDGPHFIRERLIIAAPGGVSGSADLEQEEMASVDGGRLVLLDFNGGPQRGESREVTIEVGIAEPQLLEEESTDMDTEIALVRRRTVAKREGVPRANIASVADVLRPSRGLNTRPPVPALPSSSSSTDRPPGASNRDVEAGIGDPVSPAPSVRSEGMTLEEAAEALDGPYSHTSPRSRNTLYRSATAVEANRRRQTPSIPADGRVQYRRTDGTELPHESDADGWVPPPPPYTKDAEAVRGVENMRELWTTPESGTETSTDQDLPIQGATTQELPIQGAVLRQQSVAGGGGGALPSQPPPSTSSNTTIRRRPVSTSVRSGTQPTAKEVERRRRSYADAETSKSTASQRAIQGLRNQWPNRSPSPDIAAEELRYQHRHSPSAPATPRNTSRTSSPRRPLSNYDPRSSLYRAALQPSASILPIQEPGSSTTPAAAVMVHRSASAASRTSYQGSPVSNRRSASLTLSGPNLQQRLDYPLPPAPSGAAPSEEDLHHIPADTIFSTITISHQTTENATSSQTLVSSGHIPRRGSNRRTRTHRQTASAPLERRPVTGTTSSATAAHSSAIGSSTAPPGRELSAYELNQIALQSQSHSQQRRTHSVPTAPLLSSPTDAGKENGDDKAARRKSYSRFRSPFRLSDAVAAVGSSLTSRPGSRAGSKADVREGNIDGVANDVPPVPTVPMSMSQYQTPPQQQPEYKSQRRRKPSPPLLGPRRQSSSSRTRRGTIIGTARTSPPRRANDNNPSSNSNRRTSTTSPQPLLSNNKSSSSKLLGRSLSRRFSRFSTSHGHDPMPTAAEYVPSSSPPPAGAAAWIEVGPRREAAGTGAGSWNNRPAAQQSRNQNQGPGAEVGDAITGDYAYTARDRDRNRERRGRQRMDNGKGRGDKCAIM